MLITKTSRGFAFGKFMDIFGATCSIQKSSLADEDAIWLGRDDPEICDGVILARMHLDRERVAMLLPILQRFVLTGEIEP